MARFSFLLLLLLAACSGEPSGPSREPIHDLIAELPFAEIRREPGVVDLGTPEARALLVRGWSHDEAAEGRTFVWSEGPESEMEIFLASPRDVPVSLRGFPFEAPGAPGQTVAVLANGREVAQVPFVPGEAEIRVKLPEDALRAGLNRLTFRYAWTRSPREASGGRSTDARRLAVAWDVLRFETGAEEGARVRVVGDRLYIPAGQRMEMFLRLPAGAALAFEEIRRRGGDSSLEIGLQPEGGPDRRIGLLAPSQATLTVELEEERPVRLSLAAVPEDGPPQPGSGLLLRRPRIVAPPAAKRPESAPAAVPAAARSGGGRRPNVILYMVDTLRKDHLGCYGYGKPVSPRVDAFAREAALFRNAVAQSSWTRPSVATILTGLLPRTHGVHRRRDSLSQQASTLAEMLRGHGYRTAAFVTNPNVHRSFAFGQGFETYRLLPAARNSAEDVNARAVEWLDEVGEGEPFFLFLLTIEPHSPYHPPAEFRQRFAPGVPEELGRVRVLKELNRKERPFTPALLADLTALYDAEIAANDAAFGGLVDLLKERGLWGTTMVVFLSDHGEEFHDHGGWEHGRTLHTEMLDVPLIVRLPGVGEGRAVDRLAQHVDVVPTILDSLGLAVPDAVEGRSLLPDLAGAESGPEEEAAFSWLDVDGFRAASVSTPAWRLIDERAPEADRSLFDRRGDAKEMRDLAADRPVRAGYLRSLLLAAEREGPRLKAGKGAVDEELQKRLRALGYIQ